MFNDLRYASRTLLKNPGFTIVAVLTLALGIGVNTAMFAVVNAVLLKPLPFADAERLMLVHLTVPDRDAQQRGGLREAVWSYPKYRTFLDVQEVYDSTALVAERDFALSGDDNPERVRGEVVTDRYPSSLGAAPLVGRSFTGAETHRAGEAPVAMISHRLWMRRYGGDRDLVGRTIQINATPHTVIGILPAGFRGVHGNAELWVPLAVIDPAMLQQRQNHGYYLVARRRTGVTEPAAIGAVQLYGQHVDAAFSDRPVGPENAWGATAVSLDNSRVDADVRKASFILLGAVGFVLLIACVNLTNLIVAKAITRRREVAVRMAIGASRSRVARQFLAESLLLAGLGAASGLLMAVVLLDGAAALLPEADVFFRSPIAPGVPRTSGAAGLTRIGASMIELDAVTLLFTCGVAAMTAALIALVPALQASSLRPIDAVKTGGGSGTARGFHILGIRSVLVTTQIAIALVLLAGAGLMVKSAARLHRTAIGVDPEGVLTAMITLPGARYTSEAGGAVFSQLVERVRGLPGVESVGLGNCPPISGGCNATSFWLPSRGPRLGAGRDPIVGIHWTTPGYFSALRINVVQGRSFTDRDRPGQPNVVLVNETAARTFWPNDTPIGKIVAVGQGGFQAGAEVVGVVSDVRYSTIETAPRPDVYVPFAQSYVSRMRLFVRSRLDAEALLAAIRHEVRSLDPNLPLSEVKTMDGRVGDAMWRTRVAAWLFSAFAGLALLLTAVGIFGVMSQTVSHRTPEIGVRMALGAQGSDVLGLVLGRAGVLTAIGIGAGIAIALGLTQVMTALLYETEPGDPSTLALVALLLAVVALAACYLPARRASRVNPIVALRYE
jgi:putative ABC transport system permease protein